MTPLAVIEDLDVLPDRGFSFFSGGISTVIDELTLEASPEALHWRIVVAVAPAGHGCCHSELLEKLLVIMGTVLAAAV